MKVVYHGSPFLGLRTVEPKLNRRIRNGQVIFEAHAFHATPLRWIALAYTATQFSNNAYTMGVDLYGSYTKRRIAIFGSTSLEESLVRLYGSGGYLYTFDASHFIRLPGLGDLEVITQDSVHPICSELILDPVKEMEREGVEFHFVRKKNT